MQNYQANIDDLSKCTVAIQKAGSNSIVGTGVIVTDDGLIITCYHVVGNIKTKTLDKTVDVYFPVIPNIKGHADVLEEYSDSSLDIAFLRLQEKELPKQVAVAKLSKEVIPRNDYQSFGFRESKIVEGGLYASGTIQGKTYEETNKPLQEIIQLTIDHNRSKVPHGMSGAPVLDTDTNRVIGIISASLRTETHDFAIPVDFIIRVYPDLKQKNPGLRILEFLRKIGAEGITKYERINELFVPPLEYDE
jgi:S1-C subfamily serine protease